MAARKFGLIQRPKHKPFLDILELKILIDNDFWTSPSSENAQQHALAWLLGLCCAARPGSLAQPRFRDGFLTWGDIVIRRGDTASGSLFVCQVQFRWWKGWSDEHQDTYFTTPEQC
jgi:integrase